MYAPLWCKSNASFLEGASHPEELVEQARELGLGALALTDRDGVYGAVRAHAKARELGVHLIHGAQVTIDDGTHLVLLVEDRAGWASLCRLLTAGRLRCAKGESKVTWAEVGAHAAGLFCLWGGAGSALAAEAEPADALVGPLRDAFADRLYALVCRHRHDDEVDLEARTRARAARHGLPVVAGREVLYHHRARRPLHDVLTCIRHGTTLATAGRRLRGNAEHDLMAPHGFAALWTDDPAALARSRDLADRCRFSLADLRYRYPAERLPDGTTSTLEHLRQLTFTGAAERYGGAANIPPAVTAQLDTELRVIGDLDYAGYFLTMYEIVEYCRRTGILCQGRGSAANSAVCYCLGITAVDPIRMDLLFERFLSRERAEPPDIDLDIEHDRREEVIQHVYQRYGRSHAAMVANVIRYRPKSAVRDVGKALGIPATALDRCSRMLSHYGAIEPGTLAAAGLGAGTPAAEHLLRLANEILDFPRHLSIHPGGFLLGHEPVHDIVPIENATMEARTVIQWDKDDLEELGLFKVDLLGLGALHMIHRCTDLLARHRGVHLDLRTIPAEDPATYDMICRADTVGTFQIESRAQMSMLPRLRPRQFYDLVVEVAIVRPGPISGGMVHPYLRRRSGIEEVVYPHECLRPVLAKTLGVPLFQEQVMRLAVVAADYTPGEADQLRRDMAAWRRTGKMEQHRARLIERMERKGIARDFAERVFEQIRGFADYGFPECIVGSTRVIDADTGRWVTIEDVAAGRARLRRTLSCSPELRIEKKRVLAVKRSGRKPVYRLRTALGREIEATAEHPFLTISGWRKLGQLRVGDSIASAPDVSFARMEGAEVRWDSVTRLVEVGIRETYDLEIEGHHNFLANDLVVHNSHAASFALLAYATSWLRCHYQAEFTCALLNSLPMGFYSAATLVGDAIRHGVEVRAIDVTASEWECTMEQRADQTWALRMGLKFVKGLREGDGQRIVDERGRGAFASVRDFALRTGLDAGAQARLAEAGALEALPAHVHGSVGVSRRTALWQVRGHQREQDDSLRLPGKGEAQPEFSELGELDTILWDYRASQHSTRGHPLEPLRPALAERGLPDAAAVIAMSDGRRVDYAGIVICRQRPGTASGVVFMTLEDETGFVNVVVWAQVFERYASLARTASFLGVTGKLQVEQGVVHIIADQLWVPRLPQAPPEPPSRDFH